MRLRLFSWPVDELLAGVGMILGAGVMVYEAFSRTATKKAPEPSPEDFQLRYGDDEDDLDANTKDTGKMLWGRIQPLVNKGIDCPCCGRLVVRYRRALHAEMAQFLYKLDLSEIVHPGDFHSTRDLCPATVKSSTDGAYLTHWGLVEKQREGKGEDLGMYRITSFGRDFVAGRAKVRKRIMMLCGEFEGFDGEWVTFHDCLATHFDTEDLIGR